MTGPTTARPFAAASSAAADPVASVGETIGAVLEQLDGRSPDLAVLFVSGAHVERLAEVVATVHATIGPGVLLAASGSGVLGGRREVERGPGLSLWAGSTGPPRAVRMEALDRSTILGVPDDLVCGETLLVLADARSFPVEQLFEQLPEGVAVVGGLTSPAGDVGGVRLWLDRTEYRDGALGVVLPGGRTSVLVSQGCRPIGQAWVVTRSEQHLIHELAGQSAEVRLQQMIDSLSPADRLAASRSLLIGVVADDRKSEPVQGDFLVRSVIGIEPSTRALAVDGVIEVGQMVQFQVRDTESLSVDLEQALAAGGRRHHGALVFTGGDRSALFAEPHHDAERVAEATDGGVAGMFCAGELGPIGGRNAVHRFSTAVLAFVQLP